MMRARGNREPDRPARRRALPRGSGAWDLASVGVDVGGTKIALGVVDRHGRVLDTERLPTRTDRRPAAIVDDIVDVVRARWEGRLDPSRPVGVGVAGQVDPQGTVVFGPHLGWRGVRLGALLERSLHRPVQVINDVQAATYGEWRFGAGRGVDNLLALYVGTGVGGGLVVDGRLHRGASGCAGEVGHLSVERNGRRCHCRNLGCLDAYVGGWAIAERAKAAVAREPGRGAKLLALAGSARAITARTVEEGYRQGDPFAREFVRETTGYLADGLVSIVNSLNPAMVVLGGGVLDGFRSLVPSLRRQVRARALTAATARLRIVPAALGPEGGLIGAAAFASEPGTEGGHDGLRG